MHVVAQPLTKDEALARWAELCRDSSLAELEARFEMDEYGELRMTPPPSLRHQLIADALAAQMREQLGGRAVVECPVYAGKVYVADIAWIPEEALTQNLDTAIVAPPLVVEGRSPGNTSAGIAAKVAAYLAHGVREIALIELDASVSYVTNEGRAATSALGVILVVPEALSLG
jgi:Uma2 family endonuclease